MSTPETQEPSSELRHGSVSLPGVLAQSVSGIGPSINVAIVIGLVASVSGAGTWLTWAIATIVVLLIGYCITHLTRRLVTTGGLYSLSTKGGGSFAGVVTGWAEVLFGFVSAPILPLAFGVYLSNFLGNWGVGQGRGFLLLYFVAGTIAAGLLAYRDIRLSASVMLVIEAVSVALIVVLMCVTLAHHEGSLFDSAQLGLRGVTTHDIALGVVLCILSFATFESASFLGREAKNPKRAITTAVMGSVAISGVVFIFSSYVMYLGFEGTHKSLVTSANPLGDLSVLNGVSILRYFIEAGVVLSVFSVVIANFNFMARMLFTLSRERLFPRPFTRIDKRFHTPVVGLVAVGAVDLTTLIVLTAVNHANLNIYNYLGTLSGYWEMLAYLVVCFAVLGYLRRLGILRIGHVLVALVAGAALGYDYYANTSPLPPAPYDVILYVFYAAVFASLVHYGFLALRRSPVLERVGSTVDLDTAAEQAEEMHATSPSFAVAVLPDLPAGGVEISS